MPLLLALVVFFGAFYLLVAESGEVVVLEHGPSAARTRLWIVDLDGEAYLRGRSGRAWTESVTQAPAVRLRRGGVWEDFVVEAAPERLSDYEAAALEKYGISERIIRFASRQGVPVAFRLVPRSPDR